MKGVNEICMVFDPDLILGIPDSEILFFKKYCIQDCFFSYAIQKIDEFVLKKPILLLFEIAILMKYRLTHQIYFPGKE